MTYDKKSFLSGIAVGRQLKGWATVEHADHGKPNAVVDFAVIPHILLTAATAIPSAMSAAIAAVFDVEPAESELISAATAIPSAMSALLAAGDVFAAISLEQIAVSQAAPASMGAALSASQYFSVETGEDVSVYGTTPNGFSASLTQSDALAVIPTVTQTITPPTAPAGMSGALAVISAEMEIDE